MLTALCACSPKEKQSVWTYNKETAEEILAEFESIASIPRQTGSCEAVAEYMMSKAIELGLSPGQDAAGNVIIDVPASDGFEDNDLLILQTNMDMVCSPQPVERTATVIEGDTEDSEDSDSGETEDEYYESSYDPLTDGITTIYSDGRLNAAETALGAKSGMAMATILKYLSDENSHGPLRIILTVDAYDSFAGANALDEKYLSDAKYLINLSSGKSDVIYNSAVGEYRILSQNENPGVKKSGMDSCYALRAYGLVGGNASDNIGRSRINAAVVLAGMLQKLSDEGIEFELASLYGGSGYDSIIDDATAIIAMPSDSIDDIWKIVSEELETYQDEYLSSETGLQLTMTETNTVDEVLADEDMKTALEYISAFGYNQESESLFSNLGSLVISPKRILFRQLIAGADSSKLETLRSSVDALAENYKYSIEQTGQAKLWKENKSSKLISKVSDVYMNLTGTEIDADTDLVGSECSCFAEKNKNLDIVSIGCDVWDSGTTEEFCNVESAVKILNLLEGLLPEIK